MLLNNAFDHDRLLGEMGAVYFGASILSTTFASAIYPVGSNPVAEFGFEIHPSDRVNVRFSAR